LGLNWARGEFHWVTFGNFFSNGLTFTGFLALFKNWNTGFNPFGVITPWEKQLGAIFFWEAPILEGAFGRKLGGPQNFLGVS